MHVLYCFYLNSYRTDAFLKELSASSDELTVLDFSLLRSLYRGKRINRTKYTKQQIERYKSAGNKLNYTVVPLAPALPRALGKQLDLPLSILYALLFGVFAALKLIFSSVKRVVFYNGHVLFTTLLWATWLKRIPYTTDLGDLLYLVDNPNNWTRHLETAFLKHSQSIICVSRPFKDYLIEQVKIPAKRISILSAAIPESFATHFSEENNQKYRAQLRGKIAAKENELVLVYSGGIWKKNIPKIGIRDVQGVESLCESFEQINHSGRITWLVLLGHSKDSEEFDRFRQGNYKERFVELGPYEPEGDLHKMALGGADYLCLPSYPCDTYRLYDRFKTIEYLAAGKRIVAAETPINHHLLQENGLYYQEGSTQSMAQAILKDNSNPIFIESSNLRVKEQYNWKKRNAEQLVHKIIFDGETIECY
jgi:glycosyltransferase involved in cell wall biosynthesis